MHHPALAAGGEGGNLENLTEVLGVLTENDEKAYVIGSVAAKTSEKEVILKEAQA